jgi:hypothetical protein
MRGKWSRWLVAVALVGLIAAGCEPKPEPSPFAAELEQERIRAVPQVGGVNSETTHRTDVATAAKAAQAALKETGVTLVRTSETAEGNWYLGRSLAGRQVVVEIRPMLPGTTVIKATVQGDDRLARGLLETLLRDIAGRVRE